MTLLAIDPGKRIGYALFTDKGEEIERGVIQFDDWFDSPEAWADGSEVWFDAPAGGYSSKVDQIVVEGFRHDPRVNQGGSLHWASQVEGSVKMLAALTGTPIAVQYASSLAVAKIIAGYKDPVTRNGKKKHLPDEDSAYLHGMYWLRSQDIV